MPPPPTRTQVTRGVPTKRFQPNALVERGESQDLSKKDVRMLKDFHASVPIPHDDDSISIDGGMGDPPGHSPKRGPGRMCRRWTPVGVCEADATRARGKGEALRRGLE